MIEGDYEIMGIVYQVYRETVRIDRKSTTRIMAKQKTSFSPSLPLTAPFPIHEEQITRGLRQGTWKKIESR